MSDLIPQPGRYVGQPVDRYDGPVKVTGEAKYAADYAADGLLYGFVVNAEIPKGRITSFETSKALKVDGVVDIITHENRPSLAWFNSKYADQDAPPGNHFKPLKDDEIRCQSQPIALVVAKTFEAARLGARLLEISYHAEPFETNLEVAQKDAYEPRSKKSGFEKPSSRGNFDKGYERASKKIESRYMTPPETHNPMELFASTVVFDKKNESWIVYDKTQGTVNSHDYLVNVFGLKKDKVRVVTKYMGGGFGSGLRPQYQLCLAMMASLKLKASVRVVLTRQQMFSFGHRPAALMDLRLGANDQGELQAIEHKVVQETSRFEDYEENIVNWSGLAYKCENVSLEHKLAQLDLFTPLDMRAPGATTGLFALECAMDELATALEMDPLELRKRNYTDKDQAHRDRPFSSKELMACYDQAAEKFGWSKRSAKPRSMRNGKKLVGWGFAGGIWDAFHQKAQAKAIFKDDGRLTIQSAVTDIGTGTYTILAQLAAETLGIDIKDVTIEIGDTDLPPAPLQGGSWTASTLGTATQISCRAVCEKLFTLAKKLPDSPFANVKFEDVCFASGSMHVKGDPSRTLELQKIMKLAGESKLEEDGKTSPGLLDMIRFAKNTHSAVFAEVEVDEDYGMVEVKRVVIAVAAGRILNPKTARSQILGGVVWGISQALHEESVVDHRLGRIMNHNLAEYHVPVNRDIHDIEVIFVREDDTHASPIGVKGLGEIGIVGTGAAVANAIYHATGKRVRELPIQLDDLL